MARAHLVSPSYSFFFFFFFFFLIFSSATISVFGEEYSYVKSVNPKKMKMLKEKLSHFHFFWHDFDSGSNATSVVVVEPVSNSSTLFGSITIFDNPLTIESNLSSKKIGKAQGFYASTGQKEYGLSMVMNFAFIDGKYNGSTFTVVGYNNISSTVREMPVIGGSGLLRFARGYVEVQAYTGNTTGRDGIIEYNAYVIHY